MDDLRTRRLYQSERLTQRDAAAACAPSNFQADPYLATGRDCRSQYAQVRGVGRGEGVGGGGSGTGDGFGRNIPGGPGEWRENVAIAHQVRSVPTSLGVSNGLGFCLPSTSAALGNALENALEERALGQSSVGHNMQASAPLGIATLEAKDAAAKVGAVLPTSTKRPSRYLLPQNIHGQVGSPATPWWKRDAPTGPTTVESMQKILRSLCTNPEEPLPASLVGRVLSEAADFLKTKRSAPVTEVVVPRADASIPNGWVKRSACPRLIVVGDLHGQLQDFLWIMHCYGVPSRTNVYLFNGDIADRGRHALEIFVVVFGFMLACPESVYLNRGNHEDANLNKSACGGFYDECMDKYAAPTGGLIYENMVELFALIPLATIVDQSVFVIHGGLSRTRHFLGLLRSVRNRTPSLNVNANDPHSVALNDALWSDPMETEGLAPSARGSNLVKFGPDVTWAFLEQSQLALVVRSHEVPPNNDGVYAMHKGRLLTVFSASNYCGVTGNAGGVLIFAAADIPRPGAVAVRAISGVHSGSGRGGGGPCLSYVSERFFAPGLDSGAFRRTFIEGQENDKQNVARAREEEEARRKAEHTRSGQDKRDDIVLQVSQLIVERKPALWSYFFHFDFDNTGFIDVRTWRDGCSAILGDLPWADLQTLLLPDRGNAHEVDYLAFLARFRVILTGSIVADSWSEALLSRLYSAFMRVDPALRDIFAHFDQDNDGTVTVDEMQIALSSTDFGITSSQAAALMRTMSAHAATSSRNTSGGIRVCEFLERFELLYKPSVEDRREIPNWVTDALKRIGRYIWCGNSGLESHNSQGDVAQRFFERADVDGSGLLSYAEFAVAIRSLLDGRGAGIGTHSEHWHRLRAHCGSSGGGSATSPPPPEFLSEKWLRALAEAVDVSGDGQISYLEFLAGFAPKDVLFGREFHVDVMEHVCTTIWANKAAFLVACRNLDVHHSCEISKPHLCAVLRALNVSSGIGCGDGPPLSEEQIEILIDHTHFDPATDKINYRDFFDSFQIAYVRDDGD
eukprot:TRINITY_DN38306_c0_g1_i1.p1 TRINITY_DN38306_c0_g1~~TRINITY_DN38306_c0_g1_i1.p1  ORF type:complete len:1039 (+),score=142.57 TRINITY_DN38306_c0_g1_i1:51-3119(+)